jgi:hypothetical protein
MYNRFLLIPCRRIPTFNRWGQQKTAEGERSQENQENRSELLLLNCTMGRALRNWIHLSSDLLNLMVATLPCILDMLSPDVFCSCIESLNCKPTEQIGYALSCLKSFDAIKLFISGRPQCCECLAGILCVSPLSLSHVCLSSSFAQCGVIFIM